MLISLPLRIVMRRRKVILILWQWIQGGRVVLRIILNVSDLFKSYVRTERLGFIIRYHFEGEDHDYYPDFIVRLTNDLNLILEIKGEERRKDPVKYEAAKRWVDAVNHARKYGRWAFDVCDNLPLVTGNTRENMMKEMRGKTPTFKIKMLDVTSDAEFNECCIS